MSETTEVQPPPAPEAAPAKPRRPGRFRRWLRRVGIAALAALVFACAGAVGGWVLAAQSAGMRPSPEATIVRVPTYVGQDGVSMPEVRGMTGDAAQQVLADAGIPASIVTVSSEPSAGEEGTVVDQTPAFGAASPGKVTLVVSEGAVVPDVVGTDADAATSQLETIGAQIERVQGYDASQATGTVLKVSPAAGKEITGIVRLTVNGAPTARYLSTLRAESGGCSTQSDLVVGGTTATDGLRCSAGYPDTPNESVWLLRKAVDQVKGTIGVSDAAEPGSAVRVRVLVGTRVAFDQVVKWGSPQAIDIDVRGAIRLAVRVSKPSDDADSVDAALVDMRLIGGTDAMSELPDE